MVCTFGRGRMACLARLLSDGGFSEKSSDNAPREGIDVHTIYREFCDADEPNLLEEKDMHIFDSRPLKDPLHLVCCNACEKPVKASQFAAHAERCRSIYCNGGTAVEPDGSTERKKPPRKGRKKSQATNNGSEKQKSEPAAKDAVAASKSNVDDQCGMLHPLSGDAQKMAASVENATMVDVSAVQHGGVNYSGVQGPLATKTYHSQGSHPLRAALGHLYRQTYAKECGNDSTTCVELKQDKDMLSSQVPYLNKPLQEMHKEVVPQSKEDYHQLSEFQATSKRTTL